MEDLPIKYFDTHTHGELMSRYTNDVDTLREAIAMSLPQMLTRHRHGGGNLYHDADLKPLLTLIVIGMLVIMYFVIKLWEDRSARGFKAQQKALR